MCSTGCAKALLFIFNVLFFAGGCVLLAFGIAAVADPEGLGSFIWGVPGVQHMAMVINIPAVIVSSGIYMIVLGSIMLVFGFLGCAGACLMSKPLLFFYWLLLILVIIAEIVLIILAAVNPSMTEQEIQKYMFKSLENNFEAVTLNAGNGSITLPSNLVALSWVGMQFEVGCCGAYNYADYQRINLTMKFTVNGEQITAKVPPSCCTLTTGKGVPKNESAFVDLPKCLKGETAFNQEGCYKAVQDLAVRYSYVPIIICACVIIIEVLCLALGIYLWRSDNTRKGDTV